MIVLFKISTARISALKGWINCRLKNNCTVSRYTEGNHYTQYDWLGKEDETRGLKHAVNPPSLAYNSFIVAITMRAVP